MQRNKLSALIMITCLLEFGPSTTCIETENRSRNESAFDTIPWLVNDSTNSMAHNLPWEGDSY